MMEASIAVLCEALLRPHKKVLVSKPVDDSLHHFYNSRRKMIFDRDMFVAGSSLVSVVATPGSTLS